MSDVATTNNACGRSLKDQKNSGPEYRAR